MAHDIGTYNEEILREFYTFYAANLWGSIHKNARPSFHTPLTSTLVHGFSLNISKTTIRWFPYCPLCSPRASNTLEFDNVGHCARRKFLAEHREKRGTLTFVAKIFLLLVQNLISPTKADNALTWDRVVMVASLVAGFEINFSRMVNAEIH